MSSRVCSQSELKKPAVRGPGPQQAAGLGLQSCVAAGTSRLPCGHTETGVHTWARTLVCNKLTSTGWEHAALHTDTSCKLLPAAGPAPRLAQVMVLSVCLSQTLQMRTAKAPSFSPC
jgi:hypothetical protein